MKLLNDTQMKVFKQIVYLNKSTIGKIAQATGMHRQPLTTLQRKDKPGQTPDTSQRQHQGATQKGFFAP